jgi:hypothetical protein
VSRQKIVLHLIWMGLMVGVALAGAQSTGPAYSLSLNVPSTSLSVGADIKVHITMKNTSDHDLFYRVDPSGKLLPFSFDVRDSQGAAVPKMPRRPGPGASGSYFRGTLHPGESIERDRILGKEFDLSKPGRYTIHVERQDDDVVVRSNVVTITVVP